MNDRTHRFGVALMLAVLAAGATACRAETDAFSTVDWTRTPPATGRVEGGVVEVSGAPGGGVFPLVTVEDPGVSTDAYALIGEVRYEGVEGRAFLEMWSELPDGGRYFSRTLAEQGPQGWLSGSSDWRPFELPFYLQGADPPDRVDVNVVLPGSGMVAIGPLKLIPLGADEAAWWSDSRGGLVGGIAGSLIGVLGALLGWFVARRRARTFTLGAMTVGAFVGALLIGVGVVAVVMSQPYGVSYPTLLTGTILLVVFGGLLRPARRAYADHELRRMRAIDQV